MALVRSGGAAPPNESPDWPLSWGRSGDSPSRSPDLPTSLVHIQAIADAQRDVLLAARGAICWRSGLRRRCDIGDYGGRLARVVADAWRYAVLAR